MSEDFSSEDLLWEGSPPPAAVSVPCVAQRGDCSFSSFRTVPEETAIAFTVNGSTHAVMMATPADLEDFALGFALTEGLIETPAEVSSVDVVVTRLGVEVRLWLANGRAEAYSARRRSMAGPTGCGLCGIESLTEAMRPAPHVAPARRFDKTAIVEAMASLSAAQRLHRETHAVHAAGFWTSSRGIVALREDVGRHNALDKLVGALTAARVSAAQGLVLLTSRVSVELIQKAARFGAPVVIAISAPTAAGVRLAQSCGITLVAVARKDDFEIFTHPERFTDRAAHHVA